MSLWDFIKSVRESVSKDEPVEEVSGGLKKWRKHQKPGAVMKPSTFKKIEKSAAASGATDPAKVAGAAYWKTAKAKYHKAKESVSGEWSEEEKKMEQQDEMDWETYLWKEDVPTLKGILDDMLHDEKYEANPRQIEILRTVIRRKELGEARVQEQAPAVEPMVEPGIETEPKKPGSPIAPKPGVIPKPKARLTPEQEHDLALFLKARGK